MPANTLCAIYDFELMPYALGDVLTWNVQTAIECEAAGCEKVDVYICHDARYPASIYQRDLVNAENYGLFFSELYGAFGTHPKLGNMLVYRSRDEMLSRLQEEAQGASSNTSALPGYVEILARRHDEAAVIEYFTQKVHTHAQLNAHYAKSGCIPLLRPSLGCEPDIAGLVTARFAGKRLVAIHTRLRRLDAGYGGEHSYARDSDVLEWYEFLRAAQQKHPDVMFVLLGRLQEKPLEFLRLPNVVNLRTLGLGLGHELTLITLCDLFMGTSSGFAAMANFCATPYFITRMTPASCNAYQIPFGADRLPFAQPRQVLVYEAESAAMLMRLLESGLAQSPPRQRPPGPGVDEYIDVRSWEWERAQWLAPSATTYRFYVDDCYSDKEMAFLLSPKIREARVALAGGRPDFAQQLLQRIQACFPRLCVRFNDYLRVQEKVAVTRGDFAEANACRANRARIAPSAKGLAYILATLRRACRWAYPAKMKLMDYWKRKHRIPRKIAYFFRRGAV